MPIATDASAELRAHQRTFDAFGRLVLFAILHIGLTLGCLALAFLAQAALIALVVWIGGTLALIIGFAVTANHVAEA